MLNSKLTASLCSILLLAAVAWPVRENERSVPEDSFPLSYYPMFSAKRGDTHRLHYFVGYDSTGQRYCIPHDFVGQGGMNQVRRQINKFVRSNEGDKLTEKVANKLAKCRQVPFCRLTHLELVKGEYDAETYFVQRNKTPLSETVVCHQKMERP